MNFNCIIYVKCNVRVYRRRRLPILGRIDIRNSAKCYLKGEIDIGWERKNDCANEMAYYIGQRDEGKKNISISWRLETRAHYYVLFICIQTTCSTGKMFVQSTEPERKKKKHRKNILISPLFSLLLVYCWVKFPRTFTMSMLSMSPVWLMDVSVCRLATTQSADLSIPISVYFLFAPAYHVTSIERLGILIDGPI